MPKKKVLTVVGARPQFIKAAAFSKFVSKNATSGIDEIIVHTGQHYDHNMSKVFFEQLEIPRPKYEFHLKGRSHAGMTGEMLVNLEEIIQVEKPDFVLVYGDTNSTLAGALAAVKLQIPVAHVEAGMRSFNKKMPEEINRILVDRISAVNLAPSVAAMENLEFDGLGETAHLVGDIMFDAVKLFSEGQLQDRAKQMHTELGLAASAIVLATCHRAENTDNRDNLFQILSGLNEIAKDSQVVLPIHPRLKAKIQEFALDALLGKLKIVEPLSFLDMLALTKHADLVITDSGGLQKEAMYLGTSCITLRQETEWTETVSLGWNQLAPINSNAIQTLARGIRPQGQVAYPYGNGDAAEKIARYLVANNGQDYFS